MTSFLTPEVREIALTLMEGLDSSKSLVVAILIRYEEWESLVNLKANPGDYDTSESYFRNVAAVDFLRKLNSPIEGVDPESATFQKWLESEQQCFRTNCRLNEIMDFGTLNGLPVDDRILEFLEGVRKNLLWLIGSGPDQVFPGRFGPGATMSDASGYTTVMHKMSTSPSFTPSALYYLVPWTGTKWAAATAARGDVPVCVRGNMYFTADKDALIRRPCGKEPSLNSFYQLGLGRALRSRMARLGFDLGRMQEVHRQVACLASIDDESCTIDLTSASDTLAGSLVKLLAPPGWYKPLSDLRSPMTQVNGKWYRLEKFSSMGNGFTFELETAIFSAICMQCLGPRYVPGYNMFVYGDDIIVPRHKAREVIAALRFLGFTPNERKTFVSGPFRESCGGDYFFGASVRPYYLKELPHEPQHYISLANGIRRMAHQNGRSPDAFARCRRAWFKCLGFLPRHIRDCKGPEALGDLVVHDDESRWQLRLRSNCIRYVRVYRPARFKTVGFGRFDPDIQFATALYGVMLHPIDPRPGLPEFLENRGVILRDGVSGYKVGWLPYS